MRHSTSRSMLALAACAMLACTSVAETIRPLEVLVVDAQTQTPLTNVVLYYQLECARPKSFLGIPLIDPIIYRDLVQESFRTDSNGFVRIPKRTVRLKFHEKVLSEYIHVNLDASPQPSRGHDQHTVLHFTAQDTLCNPLPAYDGALIRSAQRDALEDGWVGTRTNGSASFTMILNKESLGLTADRMVVELHRKK